MIRTIDKPTDFQTKVVRENIELVERYNTILYDLDGEGVYLVMEGMDGDMGTIKTIQPPKNLLKNPENRGFTRTLEQASNQLFRGDESIITECKEHIECIVRSKPVPTYEPKEIYISFNFSGEEYTRRKTLPTRPKKVKNLIVV